MRAHDVEKPLQAASHLYLNALCHGAKLILLVTVLGLAGSLFARWHFLPDLLTHFRVHFTIALLVCGAFLAFCRHWRWGIGGGGGGWLLMC